MTSISSIFGEQHLILPKLKRLLRQSALLLLASMLCLQFAGTAFADSGITVGNTTTLSADPNGNPGNSSSQVSDQTPDGRYVIFSSSSTNLIPGVTIPTYQYGVIPQFYELDRQTNSLQIVSSFDSNSDPISNISSAINGTAYVSNDGRYVAFNAGGNLYIRDTVAETTTEIVSGVSNIDLAGMSGDGSTVLYYVVTGTGHNEAYVYNTTTGVSTLIPEMDGYWPEITNDGKYVVEDNNAGTLLLEYSVDSGQTNTLLTLSGGVFNPVVSQDDNLITYYGSGQNGRYNLYLYHVQTGQNQLIWQGSVGSGTTSISGDDQNISFVVDTSPSVHELYVENLATGDQAVVDGNDPEPSTYSQLNSDGTQFTYNGTDSNGYSQVDVTQLSLPSTSLSAPTNLTAPSPTNSNPALSWDTVSGATSYNIYRNGVNIGSSNTNSYTDTNASQGNNSYYVTAVNGGGESSPSNTINVLVDSTLPNITYSLSPSPNTNGWNNTPVTVTFTCTSPTTGVTITSCSTPITIGSEGTSQTVTGEAIDSAGNSAFVTASVNLDQTAPALGTPNWTANPITTDQSTSLSVPVSDNLSGVSNGEYYIGNSDPGAGNGIPMSFSNNSLSSNFSNLSPGIYAVNVRAEDNASNWSSVTTTNLTVMPDAPTNLAGPYATNQATALTWNSVSTASYYNIYRNGTDIGSSNTNSFTDNSAPLGTNSYYVTAVSYSGVESSPSNTISVIYDITAPNVSITGVTGGETYPSNQTPTPVCNTSDSQSGVATNASLSVTNSGNSYTATCSGGTDNAGNVASAVSATYTVLPANYTFVNLSDSNGYSLAGAKVTIENSASQITTLNTDAFGNTYLNTVPGNYKVTVYYANGYESEEVAVSANGPNNISFTSVPVTVTINDPNTTDLNNATVAQAGNTGTFGPKTSVNANGQVTFQVLPVTNYFTAYVANGYQQQSLSVTPTNNIVTFNTDSVQVTVTKNGNPLTTALVSQAGNSGDFGSKQSVNGNGQYTFYVLPGSNTFEAFDGSNATKQSITVSGNTTLSLAVE